MSEHDELADVIPLPGGSSVLVRPIEPSDAAQLVALHQRLSDDSIYRRYFRVLPELSVDSAARLTKLTEPWRFALVAVRGDEPHSIVAVARYEGARDESVAEIALVVDDAAQRGGLGLGLLTRLCDVARVLGLTELVAEVLESNSRMLRLLARLELPASYSRDAGVVTVRIQVAEYLSEPGRLGRARAHVLSSQRVRADLSPS